MRGNKIMSMKYKKFHFRDSFNFKLMALSKLPAGFNLQAKEKGYFPHFFNTLENSN